MTALPDPLRRVRRLVRAGAFRDALAALEDEAPDLRLSPEWLLLASMASWRIGQFDQSLAFARSALGGYTERGDSDGEMRAANVAAAGHFALGRLGEAEQGFRRALTLAHTRQDILMSARCTNNLGNIAHFQTRNEEALTHYARAAGLFEQAGFRYGFAEAWHNAGVALREEGDLDAARDAADRALDTAQRLEHPRALGWALGGRGETDALRGDLDLAEAEVRRAESLARQHDDPLTVIDAQRVRAFVLRARGAVEEATTLGEQALDAARELANPWMVAKCALSLGRAYRAARRPGEANRQFTEAAEAFARLGTSQRADAARSLAGTDSDGR